LQITLTRKNLPAILHACKALFLVRIPFPPL
jgi:hypothetical protein